MKHILAASLLSCASLVLSYAYEDGSEFQYQRDLDDILEARLIERANNQILQARHIKRSYSNPNSQNRKNGLNTRQIEQQDYHILSRRGPKPPKIGSAGNSPRSGGIGASTSPRTGSGAGTATNPGPGLQRSAGSFGSLSSLADSPGGRRAAYQMEGAHGGEPSPPRGRTGFEGGRSGMEFGPHHDFAAARAYGSPRGPSSRGASPRGAMMPGVPAEQQQMPPPPSSPPQQQGHQGHQGQQGRLSPDAAAALPPLTGAGGAVLGPEP